MKSFYFLDTETLEVKTDTGVLVGRIERKCIGAGYGFRKIGKRPRISRAAFETPALAAEAMFPEDIVRLS